MNATSNQKARPWTVPPCVIVKDTGISMLWRSDSSAVWKSTVYLCDRAMQILTSNVSCNIPCHIISWPDPVEYQINCMGKYNTCWKKLLITILTTIGCLQYSLTAACLRLDRSTPWNACWYLAKYSHHAFSLMLTQWVNDLYSQPSSITYQKLAFENCSM